MGDQNYPSEEDLETISIWPPDNQWDGLMDYVRDRWKWAQQGYWTCRMAPNEGGGSRFITTVATGGWSGNESLLYALRQNTLFWAMCWWSSCANGEHVFRLPVPESPPDATAA